MTDRELLLAIQAMLAGKEWTLGTLESIAMLLTEYGYQVHDSGGDDGQ